jgi:hypothetical protein
MVEDDEAEMSVTEYAHKVCANFGLYDLTEDEVDEQSLWEAVSELFENYMVKNNIVEPEACVIRNAKPGDNIPKKIVLAYYEWRRFYMSRIQADKKNKFHGFD